MVPYGIGIVIIVIIIMLYMSFKKRIAPMKAADGNTYRVYYSDTVDNFVLLTKNINLLIQRLQQMMPSDPRVIKLISKFDPNKFIEKLPSVLDNDTSYVLNYGEEIHICMRDKDNELHDFNVIMFVTIHEITHLATDIIGVPDPHTPDFWSTFKVFLKHAVDIGIYIPVDYKKHPYFYCDELLIDFNPLF